MKKSKQLLRNYLYVFAVIALSCLQQAVAYTNDNPEQDIERHAAIFDSIIPDPEPIVVYGEPRGSKIEFLRTGDSTCGHYLYAKVTVPPGSGPPPDLAHISRLKLYTD